MKRMIALMLFLTLLLGLFGCEQPELRTPGTFYYLRTETAYTGIDGVIAPEQRELDGIREDLGAILDLYCQGPVSAGLENPLPPDAFLLSHTLEDEVLTLVFSPQLAQLNGIELTAAAGCLTRTFLGLTGAKKLILKADGALLGGQTAMELSTADLELQDDSLDRMLQDFTVYYTNLDRRYLIGQEVSVDPSAQESIPMQLLELMLMPPAGSNLHSALPEGTRIEGVSVVDGLCTVELSTEFEDRRFYSLTSQVLSLMSVVNTLTALPEIQRVEFVCEGNLLIHYGALAISAPLVRDERCIGPVRTGLGEQDITIYLSHGEEGRLLPMPTRLRQTGAAPQAELILRYLLQDPGTNGITSRLPAGTQVNDITITNGTCYVDLSAQYLNSPADLRWAGRVIAASLCNLPGVEQVQILVDGKIPAGFDPAWFGPLKPNSDWFL